MSEKLRRYGKHITVFICTFVILAGSVFSFSFESNASAFSVNYAEPSAGENQGYLIVEIADSLGNRLHNTFFWNVNMADSNGQNTVNSGVSISIRSDSIVIDVGGVDLDYVGDWSIGAYWSTGSLSVVHSNFFTNYDSYTYTWSDYTVVGFNYKGNVTNVLSYISNNQTPTIVFNQQESAIKLQAMVDKLLSMLLDNDTIISQLTSIVNNTDTVESKLQSLIELENLVLEDLEYLKKRSDRIVTLQKESISWLEKIWNSIQDFLGLEGEESTEKLPDEEISSTLESEEALFQDTTDAENNLSFSIDSNSNNVVWNVMERFLNSNEKVFGSFIGILTLGIITLLLNR